MILVRSYVGFSKTLKFSNFSVKEPKGGLKFCWGERGREKGKVDLEEKVQFIKNLDFHGLFSQV